MTQQPKRKPRASGDEGAMLTKRIVDEVKRLRAGLDWSAERLAEEMTAAGVPWTRDVVVNLENGRRGSVAVHELLALAWVLDVADPVDLLVPHGERLEGSTFPVTPGTLVNPDAVRMWFRGETGPLRARLTGLPLETEESIRRSVRKVAAEQGETDEQLIETMTDNIVAAMRLRMLQRREGEDTDGEG